MPETYVLVAGAWHGGWAWRPVAEQLRATGAQVLVPTLPGLEDGADATAHSLGDVIDFVTGYVEQRDLRDVALVAHSWGGYVATGAAPHIADRLSRLVYWSAFVPSAGRPLIEEVPPPIAGLFSQLAAASGDNSVAMPFEVWRDAFIQDASEDVQRLTHALLSRQPMQYFTTTVEPFDPASIGVPITYLLSSDDIALPPGEYGWDRFAERLGVRPQPVPGSHEALFTRPAELAEAIAAAR